MHCTTPYLTPMPSATLQNYTLHRTLCLGVWAQAERDVECHKLLIKKHKRWFSLRYCCTNLFSLFISSPLNRIQITLKADMQSQLKKWKPQKWKGRGSDVNPMGCGWEDSGQGICGASNSNTSLLLMKFKVKLEIVGWESKHKLKNLKEMASFFI